MKLALKIGGAVLGLFMALLLLGYFALRRPDIPFATLERQYGTPESRFVDLPGGIHLHYRDQGNPDGQVLLLIHGFGASLVDWEPWVSQLRGKYRLVSVDLPGHGLTGAPETFIPSSANNADIIEQFAPAIGLSKFTAIGNSRGGEIAWVLALRHPQIVARLVLVDASGWEWQHTRPTDNPALSLLDSPPVSAIVRQLDKSRIMGELLRSAFYDQRLATDAIVQRYVDLSRAPGHRAILDRTFVETLRGLYQEGWASDARLAAITAPTLILWGDHDKLVDPGDAARFAHAIADSTLIIYTNVGHVPMEEAPARSATDLDHWLDRSQPR